MPELLKGVKLIAKTKEWRVLCIKENVVYLCDLNTKPEVLSISAMPMDLVSGKLKNKTWTIEDEAVINIDRSKLDRDALQKYSVRKEIIEATVKAYGPTFTGLTGHASKPAQESIIKAFNISRRSYRKLIIKYLKSGFKDHVLYNSNFQSKKKTHYAGRKRLDGTSPYRLTQRDYDLMDKWLRKYKKSTSPEITVEYCYVQFLKNYIDKNGELNAVHPSMKQFRFYFNNRLTQEERDIKATSKREVRNDKRLLYKPAGSGVYEPMDFVEIDAHEMDVKVVDEETRSVVVGRPIVYAMIDVETRVIVAMTVSFDNNSQIGMNRLFESLVDPKIEFFERHPDAPNYAWPYDVFPANIRTDNGSDFVSRESRRIATAFGIESKPVPAATGSMKGLVERLFFEQEQKLGPAFAGRGLIKKRNDSNDNKKACMTINEIRFMIEELVYFHNTTLCEGIPMSKALVDAGVERIPCKIWEFEVEQRGLAPKPILDHTEYKMKLLKHAKATVRRYGIGFDNIKYINPKDGLLEHTMYENTGLRIEILYNPAFIDSIYYRLPNTHVWNTAYLNPDIEPQASMAGMTFDEADKYKSTISQQTKRLQEEKRVAAIKFYDAVETVASEAKKAHKGIKNDTNHISEEREKAKYAEQKKLGEDFSVESIENERMKSPDIPKIDHHDEIPEETNRKAADVSERNEYADDEDMNEEEYQALLRSLM